MNKITGKILHQESLIGIPNLIVLVYDLDPDSQGTLEETFGDTSGGNNDNPAEALAGIWNGFPGDRLGSVFTDAQGTFELNYDDDAFRYRNPQEIRPDLFVIVLKPDTPNNHPNTVNPTERFLYRTGVPLFNAGKQESVIVQLPTALLEEHNIPIPQATPSTSQQGVEAMTDTYLQTMNRSQQLHSNIQSVQNGLIGNQAAQNLARKANAKRFVADLKKIHPILRNNTFFVNNEEELAEAKNLQLDHAVTRQQAYGQRVQTKMHIDLSQMSSYFPNYGQEFLDTIRGRDHYTLNVQLGHLGKFLRQHSNTTELIRTRSVWDSIVQRYKAQEIIEEATQTTTTTEEEPPTESDTTLGEEIRAMIVQQLSAVNGEAPINATLDNEHLTKLQDKVNNFKLHSGPADTTAYHDFHTLQIAFEHVWTEAFDEKLRDQVASLYEELVKVREDSDLEDENESMNLQTVEDYTRFLQDMNAELNSLDGTTLPLQVSEALPTLTINQWNLLSPSQQFQVINLANTWKEKKDRVDAMTFDVGYLTNYTPPELREEKNTLLAEAEQIKTEIQQIVNHPQSSRSRVQEMLEELGNMIREPYAFELFHPNTTNFGLLATYRQKWEPKDYQVGSLVSTIPLAPGESRKYTKKMVKKRARSEKEIEKTLRNSKSNSSYTSRAQAEITQKASTTTNFQQSAEGSINFGIGSITSNTSFSLNQQQESAKAKKSFREAVVKASQEYKNERHIEVNTSSNEDFESTTSGEIKNTNNEITTTYLFYELERQYRISEHLHKMTPVIMVAQEVPAPHEIDEDWILAHEWILRRVLLDDLFNEALDYISDGIVGDEITVATKKRLMLDQRELVKKLETFFDKKLATRDTLMEALRAVSGNEAIAENRSDRSKIARIGKAIFTGGASLVLPSPSEELFGGEDAESRVEILKANREAIERRLELMKEELPAAKAELNQAISALERTTKAYTDASAFSFRKRTQVDQLRIHLKQNILYYMQAIWDHEPPDQRFFRLYNLDVTMPSPLGWNEEEGTDSSVTIEVHNRPTSDLEDLLDSNLLGLWLDLPILNLDLETKKLHQIANLDNPLGYKGNYMIFPLQETVYLTDHMMQEYVDGYLGLRDPDDAIGEFPDTEGLIRFTEEIYSQLTEEERTAVQRVLLQRLTSQRKDDELIVVPTGQLFIEALPGTHALLEPFKLQHRRLDVEKVRSEVLRSGLENLRYLERLEADMLEDPDTEKKVIVRDGEVDIDVEG